MNSFKKFTLGIAMGACSLVLVSCGQEQQAAQKGPPPPVTAVTVVKQEVPINYQYTGRIAAYKETEVRARVGGILLHRNFDEGARVKEGDILFQIDPATYEAEVARQKATVAQAKANYQQSILDANRAVELLKQRVQSTAQRDKAVALRDASAASLKQAEAALRTAELNLEYTKVAAPISGLTSREAVSEGSLISVGGLLTTITQNQPVYVNFSYTDTEAGQIQKLMADMKERGEKIENLHVRIRFGDGTEYPKLGVIDFTSPSLDTTTGTLGVRAVVENENQHLVPGQFVRVTVVGLKLDNSIVIPEGALLQDSSGKFVYIVDKENNIEKRPVIVIRQVENRAWLIEEGKVVEKDAATIAEEEAILVSVEKANKDAGKNTADAPKVAISHQQRVGIFENDRVITDGQYRIEQGMGQLKPGEKFKVNLTILDGKPVAKPADDAAQAGKKK